MHAIINSDHSRVVDKIVLAATPGLEESFLLSDASTNTSNVSCKEHILPALTVSTAALRWYRQLVKHMDDACQN